MDEKSTWSPTWQAMDKVGLTQILADHGSQTTINDWHDYLNIFFNNNIFQDNLGRWPFLGNAKKVLKCVVCVREVEKFFD